MSRSIHVTRRDVSEIVRSSYADEERKAEEVESAKDDLNRKRRIKSGVKALRDRKSTETLCDVDAIPIRVRDQGPNILHAASVDDIRAVFRRLPKESLNGLSEVVLSLGDHTQREGDHARYYDPDPIVGRLGEEILPGVYEGRVLGRYDSDARRITIHAYVSRPGSDISDAGHRVLEVEGVGNSCS